MTVNSDDYVRRVRELLTATSDPIERVRVASTEISALGAALETLATLRADAVRAARETMSAVAVADALGVTRARVYQLLQ